VSDVETFLVGNGRASRAFYSFGRFVVVGFLRVWCRVTIEGREHLPQGGAFVLAPVHRSLLDTPFAGAVTKRRLRYMGKDSMWKYRSAGWLFSALGAFPVSRDRADREALQRCIAVLGAGEPLVIFPEGERKSGPLIQPLAPGAAYIAAKAGVPIIPLGIGGSEVVLPKGSRFVRPRKVHLVIGAPIEVRHTEGRHVPRNAVAELSDRLHDELQRLFDAAQARVS
jgi:1-acyl-sn-glycerol-3-phosphate acyltransferase